MTYRVAAAALLDEHLTVGDLRALVAFADRHNLADDSSVYVEADEEWPHQNYAIEVNAHPGVSADG